MSASIDRNDYDLGSLSGDSHLSRLSRSELATVKFLARSGVRSGSYFSTPTRAGSPGGVSVDGNGSVFSDVSSFDVSIQSQGGQPFTGAQLGWQPPVRPAPVQPCKPDELAGLSKEERAAVIKERALAALALPRWLSSKVYTDGMSASTMEKVVKRARNTPGVGDYDDDVSFRAITASGTSTTRRQPPGSPISSMDGSMTSSLGAMAASGPRWRQAGKETLERSLTPGPAHYHTSIDLSLDGIADRSGRSRSSTSRSGKSRSSPEPARSKGIKTDIEMLCERAAASPGPADYGRPALPDPTGGGRFNKSMSKSDIEWAIFRGKQRPGPGTYHTSARPRQGGGRFNESNPKSDMDWLVLREKAQPGPGFYDAPLAATSGGSLSRSSAKSDLEAAVQRAKALPGPGSHDPNHNLRFRSSGSGRFLTVYRPPHLQTTKASHAGDITSPVLSRRGNRSSL